MITSLARLNYHGEFSTGGRQHDDQLSALDGFFYLDVVGNVGSGEDDDRCDCKPGDSLRSRTISPELIRRLMNKTGGRRFKADLVRDVHAAVERFGCLRCNKSLLRSAVVGSLRESGYNAGVCKTRWKNNLANGLTAGSYEYIDVIGDPLSSSSSSSSSEERYVVDLEFAAEFEIARATEEYDAVVKELPDIFVGKADQIKQAVKIIAEAVVTSMRSKKMHVPPWRKARYMRAKWLGPSKRTTNPTTTSIRTPC
ncbi:hypothetical protein ZOSMA_5G02420 [Zostera marina]|uniref:Uncharacterized protein n=1 Tax=Zostera marina TaxID=29655 RepID=A0A0K9NWJ8_ZOSMR|nr:hypothetical protein ZOSMA_5G02420 [Zostera marina]